MPKPSGKCSLKFALVSDLQVNDTQGGCCFDVSSRLSDCTRKSGATLGTTLGSDPDLVGDSMEEMTGVP